MDIIEILEKCKPEEIIFTSVSSISGLNWRGRYWINREISEEEQVITLIHELLHDIPKYRDEFGHTCGSYIYPNHELHTKLEKEALEIYYNRSSIRGLVLEKLKLAKVIQKIEESK